MNVLNLSEAQNYFTKVTLVQRILFERLLTCVLRINSATVLEIEFHCNLIFHCCDLQVQLWRYDLNFRIPTLEILN